MRLVVASSICTALSSDAAATTFHTARVYLYAFRMTPCSHLQARWRSCTSPFLTWISGSCTACTSQMPSILLSATPTSAGCVHHPLQVLGNSCAHGCPCRAKGCITTHVVPVFMAPSNLHSISCNCTLALADTAQYSTAKPSPVRLTEHQKLRYRAIAGLPGQGTLLLLVEVDLACLLSLYLCAAGGAVLPDASRLLVAVHYHADIAFQAATSRQGTRQSSIGRS